MECIKLDIKNKKACLVISPIPKVERDDEVIVKVIMCGVCGTDIHILHGQFEANDGVILGHEIAGTVHEIPKGCKSLKVGDRVVVNPNISCHRCRHCKKGLYNFCEESGLASSLGIGADGGWAQYCKVHISLVFTISDSIPYEHAVLCEPLSCVVHALDKLPPINISSNILIIGAGIIGLLWSVVLHVMGHRRVYISEPNSNRQTTVNNLGLGYKCSEWNELFKFREEDPTFRIDLCIDCSGNVGAIQAAIPFLQSGGTLLVFGVADPSKILQISVYELYKRELTLMGTAINTNTSMHKAVALMEALSNRYITIDKMAMKKFKLSEYQEALDTFTKSRYSKIIFEGNNKLLNSRENISE